MILKQVGSRNIRDSDMNHGFFRKGKAMGNITEKMDLKTMCEMPGYHLKCSIVDMIQSLMESYFYHCGEQEEAKAALYIKELIECMREYFPDKKDMVCAARMFNTVKEASGYLEEQKEEKGHFSCEAGNVIGKMYHSLHGESLTAIWSGWAEYIFRTYPEKMISLGKCVWNIENDSEEIIREFVDFYKKMGMPVCLGQLAGRDLLEEEIDILAEQISIACGQKEAECDIRSILTDSNHW